MEFKPAKCPSCGGELQVPPDREVIKCMYCGNDVIVKKAITSKVSVELPALIKLADSAFKGKNYEESYNYANRILELDSNNVDAWLYKGKIALALTSYANPRINEALKYFERVKEISLEKYEENWPTLKSEILLTELFLYDKAMELKNSEAEKYYISAAFHLDTELKHAGVYLSKIIYHDLAAYFARNCFGDDGVKKIVKKYIEEYPNFKVVITDESEYELRKRPEYQDEENVWIKDVSHTTTGTKKELYEVAQNLSVWGIPCVIYKKVADPKCFIATATYGTPFAQEVEYLRYWRDKYLIKSFFRNLFVEFYYKISPPIADWISKSEKRKAAVRFALDKFIKFLRRKI